MKIIVIGSSGHAKVIIDAINCVGKNTIAGLIDDFREVGEQTSTIPIIGKVSDIENIEHKEKYNYIIAVGDNKGRFDIYNKLKNLNLNYISVVHPSAIVSKSVTIGEGTFIASGAIVNSCTVIGNHCIVNTGAQLDHDNFIDDFVSIAPRAALAGNVLVHKGVQIGMGAIIIEKIFIGKHSIIGAGSVVLTDISKYSVAYGSPCKFQYKIEMQKTFA